MAYAAVSPAWLLLLLVSLIVSALAQETPPPEGQTDKWNLQTLFKSKISETVVDGPSEEGYMCRPGYGATVTKEGALAFVDMCGAGSALRIVDRKGIRTVAGSLTERGYVNGPLLDARFNGIPVGHNRVNGLTRAKDIYYIADTNNNAVRAISSTGVTTLVGANNMIDGKPLSFPSFITPFPREDNVMDLYISDTENSRILYATVNQTANGAELGQLSQVPNSFQPGSLAIDPINSILYFVRTDATIGAISLTNFDDVWSIGNPTCLGYLSAFSLNMDRTELWYFGVADGTLGIYALSVTDKVNAATLCPRRVLAWDSSLPPGVQNIIPRTKNSWYVVATTQVEILYWNSLSPTPSLPPPDLIRRHGVAAFPASALPLNDTCLMSQLYYWVRVDAELAFETDDYLTAFVPVTNPNMSIPGDMNVSTWCGNITAHTNKDETVHMIDFWGPSSYDVWYTQDALSKSPWENTHRFLDGLRGQGWGLDPLCFYNCSTMCDTSTASPQLCVDYRAPPKCDSICKRAVVATVLLGVTAAVLVVLAIVSPSNLFTAVVMVPIV